MKKLLPAWGILVPVKDSIERALRILKYASLASAKHWETRRRRVHLTNKESIKLKRAEMGRQKKMLRKVSRG